MALTENDVFYALLRSSDMTLRYLCEKSGLSYQRIQKRLMRGTLHTITADELDHLCKILGVSYEDLYTLLRKASDGEFPDDYPTNSIKLEPTDRTYHEDRTEVMLLTQYEFGIIYKLRAESEKAVKMATGRRNEFDEL